MGRCQRGLAFLRREGENFSGQGERVGRNSSISNSWPVGHIQPAGHEFDMLGLDHGRFEHSVLEQWLWLQENWMRNLGTMTNDGNRHGVRKITS